MEEKEEEKLPEGVSLDQFGRKVWDRDFFAKKASDGEKNDFGTNEVVKSRLRVKELKAREDDFNLEFQVGKKDDGESFLSGGFVCKDCEVSFNNNNDFLDHMNSSEHNFRLGIGLRAKKATLESVRERLRRPPNRNKKKKLKKKKKQTEITLDELNRRIEERQKIILKKPRIKKQSKTGKYQSKNVRLKSGKFNVFSNPLVAKAFQVGNE